ncbi:hypothetical protein G3O08_09990 [Cryomorpha ignava]|uniref:Uncharacterized protein n=1 Tax=Cryomorpha ignava TaxID=101383 RepID=A0A7K3WRZ5_9FLAO|nr:hypothetical protein [Cryomorpha ignava]NEN23831.1 hypothetical protein [Cryomorpha ignava]
MKKVSAILLALLILSSNLSIALSTHFCGGKAVKSEFSIGNYDLDCGMADMESCNDLDWNFNKIQATPCCENQHSFFKINDRYQNLGAIDFGFIPFAIVKDFSLQVSSIVQTFPKALFQTYKPPLPKQAVFILYQVFRL